MLMDHLDHRREAVGGTGSGSDDLVGLRFIQVIVHAHHHVQHLRFFHRRGDHHTFDALLEVRVEHLDLFHLAAGLNHQIATRPVGFPDAVVAAGGNAPPIYHNGVTLRSGRVTPAAMHGIKIQQVRQRGRISGGIVDVYKFDLWPAPGGAQYQPAHAAKTIDANLDAHMHDPDQVPVVSRTVGPRDWQVFAIAGFFQRQRLPCVCCSMLRRRDTSPS